MLVAILSIVTILRLTYTGRAENSVFIIRKQKCIFESFFVPDIGEYYSYKIDIIPKMKYNILEREVYSLCI